MTCAHGCFHIYNDMSSDQCKHGNSDCYMLSHHEPDKQTLALHFLRAQYNQNAQYLLICCKPCPHTWRQAWRPSSQRWTQEPLMVRNRDGNPREDPLAVHCFCVCSRSAPLVDLLGVSRSRDLLSVPFIYPRIFLHVFIAYRLLVGFLFVWLYSAICSCVLVVLVKLSVLA